MKLALVVAFVALAGAPALARADDGVSEIVVEVGQTVGTDVGYAMGSFCDDEAVVHAEMQNDTTENNRFVVTGLKPGSTLCRVGTVIVEHRPTLLFKVTVVAPPPAAKPTKQQPKRR